MLAVAWLLPLSASMPFELVLHLRSQKSPSELEKLYWRVATPSSPEYLAFRNREELSAFMGGSERDVAEAVDWLTSLAGTNIRISPIRDQITAAFAGNELSQVESMWSERGLPLSPAPEGVTLVVRRDFVGIQAADVLSTRPASQIRARDADSTYSMAAQKAAYGIPVDLAATHEDTRAMVWGPGTFGYSPSGLASFKAAECPGLNTAKVTFDTSAHGQPGGDNFGEGTLDTHMISCFGMNASVVVSNTNTSMSTEEGSGFGLAFLDFITQLASRKVLPQVLSLSLGSLSPYSCEMLCAKAAAGGSVGLDECKQYLQTQRQVCMYMSAAQAAKIDSALMALGLRGVSVFGSSGDGGSHWSFGKFSGWGKVPRALNKIGCEYNVRRLSHAQI